MSKGHDGAAKTEKAEKTKETFVGEAKKTEHKKPDMPAAKGKGHNPGPDGCFAWGCKSHASRFNFCSEHFDQFKFGLIKKTGEPVSDFEKKFEHYQSYKTKKGAHRAA